MDYDLPDVIRVEADGPVRIVRLSRPEQLNAINDELHLGLTRLFPQLSADRDARVAVITGEGRAFSAGRRLRSPRPDGQRPRAAPRRDRRGPRARAQHDPLPRPGRRRGQRSGGRSRLQRHRALRRRVHGRVGVPLGSARDGRARGGRRRTADLAVAHEPAAREGVRVHRRPDHRGARRRDRAWRTTCAPTARCCRPRSPPRTRSPRCRVRPSRRPSACSTCTSSARCSPPSTSRWRRRRSRSTRPTCARTSTASSVARR